MTRTTRRFSALVTMFALIFASLSIAAHACTEGMRASTLAQTAMPEDCPEGSDHDANVCWAHCTADQQSNALHITPDIPPSQLLEGVFAAAFIVVNEPMNVVHVSANTFLARTTSPPISIRHVCFRV